MSDLTKEQLSEIYPNAGQRIVTFYDTLCAAMDRFEINTPLRMAAFLAQVGVESGELRYVREIASGKAYERRLDLGNSSPGDGVKYRGRGLIQLTGKNNYISCMLALGIDCVEHPELLELPENACATAAWFWSKMGLNYLADRDEFTKITQRVNGGQNGAHEREGYYKKARKVLKC